MVVVFELSCAEQLVKMSDEHPLIGAIKLRVLEFQCGVEPEYEEG